MSAVLVRAGDLIADKYRLDRQIGAGGMGVVFAATHIHLEQQVALKFLLREAAANPEVVERFRREARAAVKIQSEHVARVIDIGELQDRSPYIVMEYLEGDDLENIVRRDGPLPVQDAVRYVLQACEALAEVHVQGIVHRDIKPANLFLAARADGGSIVKLLDFGISKAAPVWTEAGVQSLTQTTSVIGSPRYMSPEQLRSSRDVDARSDVWALGVTLFELLGGQSPFATGTMPEVCASILKDEPLSLHGLRPEVDDELESVILRCLRKEVDDRFSDVGELAEALLFFGPPATTEISVERIRGVLQQAAVITAGPPLTSRTKTTLTPLPSVSPSLSRQPRPTTPLPFRPERRTTRASGPNLGTPPALPEAAVSQLSVEDQIRHYLERIGDRTRVPRVAIDPGLITGLNLDHRAGFLISMIDGMCTIDEILDVSAMPRVETLALLLDLVERGIVVVEGLRVGREPPRLEPR